MSTKPIIKERNERIRMKYKKKLEKHGVTASEAIQQLVREFSSWNLSYESIRQIIGNKNYGKRPGQPVENKDS